MLCYDEDDYDDDDDQREVREDFLKEIIFQLRIEEKKEVIMR